ncbi:MAG: deoxyribonuclease IV [Gemmatimonadota bacterium]|nr:deoxyribonuclease IV [Gemmatimonadota bacterium]
MPASTTERLGAHVSIQGGVPTAPPRGTLIGATAIQIFTKTPNQWREPVIAPETAAAFRVAMAESAIRSVVSHDSYLINLASPDPALSARSTASFIKELERCSQLGIPGIVSHPGNYIDDREAGLERNAACISKALRAVPGPIMVYLETTAGTGTSLGRSFEELATLRQLVATDRRDRVGFCADTCHLYSAGYDLRTGYDAVWEEWERIIGLQHLHCLHLNDSKTPFASNRDRHELIAEGSLGPEPFRRLMADPRFVGIPKLLETPKGDDEVSNDRKMLRRLRTYARNGAKSAE